MTCVFVCVAFQSLALLDQQPGGMFKLYRCEKYMDCEMTSSYDSVAWMS